MDMGGNSMDQNVTINGPIKFRDASRATAPSRNEVELEAAVDEEVVIRSEHTFDAPPLARHSAASARSRAPAPPPAPAVATEATAPPTIPATPAAAAPAATAPAVAAAAAAAPAAAPAPPAALDDGSSCCAAGSLCGDGSWAPVSMSSNMTISGGGTCDTDMGVTNVGPWYTTGVTNVGAAWSSYSTGGGGGWW